MRPVLMHQMPLALDFLERQKGSELTDAQAEDLALQAQAWVRRPARKRTAKAK